MKIVKWLAIGFVGLLVLSAIAGGSSSSKSDADQTQSASAESDAPATKTKSSESTCTNRASDDCTPHVEMGSRVRVDALYWDVTGVDTTATLGDQTYGLGAKANGRFVVVDLNVKSDRNESATLTDEIIQLEIDGNTYKADSDGTIAAIGDGDEPLWFDDIGPDVQMNSKVVFDVPESAMGKQASVRFGELGFGPTKGYVDLPSLGA